MPVLLTPNTTQEYSRTNRFAAMFIGADNEYFEKNLLEFRLPTLTLNASELWDGIVKTRFVNSGEYGNVGMTLYCTLKTDPIYKWMEAHHKQSDNTTGANASKMNVKYKAGGGSGYKRDMKVSLLDGNGEKLATWGFFGCQISSVSFSQLTYNSQGEVLTASLEILADRVVLPPSLH